MRSVKHAGSALGEAIGKLIQEGVFEMVQEVAHKHGFRATSRRLRNSMDNLHEVDIVVEDVQEEPVILIEPKYLRYTKHNWDKGSRLCIAHYLLRRNYPTVRKSICVLAGNWTEQAKQFIHSFGIETYEIPFDTIVTALQGHGVEFEWHEQDRDAPVIAWATRDLWRSPGIVI